MHVPNAWVTLQTINPNRGRVITCRYGVPGNRLWVRETWAVQHQFDPHKPSEIYAAGLEMGVEIHPHYAATEELGGLIKRPSVYMPRWASRIILEIVGVRVQRLNDITDKDAKAEGAEVFEWRGDPDQVGEGWVGVGRHIFAFRELWDSINAKRGFGWDANPWVWALTFKRATPMTAPESRRQASYAPQGKRFPAMDQVLVGEARLDRPQFSGERPAPKNPEGIDLLRAKAGRLGGGFSRPEIY